jgi:hypothetical protein
MKRRPYPSLPMTCSLSHLCCHLCPSPPPSCRAQLASRLHHLVNLGLTQALDVGQHLQGATKTSDTCFNYTASVGMEAHQGQLNGVDAQSGLCWSGCPGTCTAAASSAAEGKCTMAAGPLQPLIFGITEQWAHLLGVDDERLDLHNTGTGRHQSVNELEPGTWKNGRGAGHKPADFCLHAEAATQPAWLPSGGNCLCRQCMRWAGQPAALILTAAVCPGGTSASALLRHVLELWIPGSHSLSSLPCGSWHPWPS